MDVRAFLTAALFALLATACECGAPQTEEERLRERIDTTKVHLYAASRHALAGGDDPDAVRTREHIGTVIRYFQEHEGAPPASETLALGSDLWALRERGQQIVRSEDEEGQRPILPILLALSRPGAPMPAFLGEIDLNTEHAIFLVAFTVLKLRESVPTPIPIEIVLYEAYRTRPESLTIEWLEPGVRVAKAWVYSTNDFCDLASREADAIDARSTEDWMALLAEARPDLEADRQRQGVAGIRAAVHGATGQCYLSRGDDAKAAPHLSAFCDAAEEYGTPPEDLAILRAYLAYRDGDLERTREHLRTAKRSEMLTAQQKDEIDRILEHLDRNESGALDRYFDGAFIATVVMRIALAQLAESAAADGAGEQAQAMGHVREAAGALGGGIGTLQSAEQSAEGAARSLWDRIFGD